MEKYINQILEKNNRVIVPDFGAFIVKQRKPLTIVFNEFLQYNDGMLVDTISKIEDIDREKAKEQVDAFVKSVSAKLDKGQKYPLEKLGTLIKSSSGKISLEGDDVKTTAQPKPAAKAVKKEEVKEEKTKVEKGKVEKGKAEEEKKAKEDNAKMEQEKKAKEDNAKMEQEKKVKAELEKKAQDEKAKLEQEKKGQDEKVKQEQEKKDQAEKERLEREKNAQAKLKAQQAEKNTSSQPSKAYSYQSTASNAGSSEKKTNKRNILLWVVIIVLINGILVTGYFMYNKDLPAFLNKSETEEMLIEEPIIEEDNYVTESYEEAAESTPVEEEVTEENIKPEAPPQKKHIQQGTKYYVVAGAFSNEQNADNLVIDLNQKGYNSEKFGKIGSLHAVSYDVFSSKSEADQLLRKIQAEMDPQAWIKRVD